MGLDEVRESLRTYFVLAVFDVVTMTLRMHQIGMVHKSMSIQSIVSVFCGKGGGGTMSKLSMYSSSRSLSLCRVWTVTMCFVPIFKVLVLMTVLGVAVFDALFFSAFRRRRGVIQECHVRAPEETVMPGMRWSGG